VHTVARARRGKSKDSTASVPDLIVIAVPHGRVRSRRRRIGRRFGSRVEVETHRSWWRMVLRAPMRWRRGRRWWWRTKLEARHTRRRLLDPSRRRRGFLQQGAERPVRRLLPGLERSKLVQGSGHHVLEPGELLRHGLHRRLQFVNRGRHFQLKFGRILLRRRDLGKKIRPNQPSS